MPTVSVYTSVEGYWTTVDGVKTWTNYPQGLFCGGYMWGSPIDRHTATREIYMEFPTSGLLPMNAKVLNAYLSVAVATGLGRVYDDCSWPDPDPGVGWAGNIQSGYVFQHENGSNKHYIVPTGGIGTATIGITMAVGLPSCDPQPPAYGMVQKFIGWYGTASGQNRPTLVIEYVVEPPPAGGGAPRRGYRFEGLWFANKVDSNLVIGYESGIVEYPNLTEGARFEEKANEDGSSSGVPQSLQLLLNIASLHDIVAPSVGYEVLVELLGASVDGKGTLDVLLRFLYGGAAAKTYSLPVTGKREAALQLPKFGRLEQMLLEFALTGTQRSNVEDLTLKKFLVGSTKQQRIGTK